MKWKIVAAVLSMTVSFGAFADSEHECQGNSCNGGGTVSQENTAVGIGVGVGVSKSQSSARSSSASASRSTSSSSSTTAVDASSNVQVGGSTLNGGSSTQSVTVTDSGKLQYSGSYTVKNVPNPPDVISNPTAPCRIAFSGSGSGAGFGVGIGGSVLDEGCNRRENARTLYNFGEHEAALLLMCKDAEVASVLGKCKQSPSTAPVQKPAGEYINGGTTLY